MKQAIIFFTRVPVKGKVKTRLAQKIGDREALSWQSDFIRKITKEIFFLWQKMRKKPCCADRADLTYGAETIRMSSSDTSKSKGVQEMGNSRKTYKHEDENLFFVFHTSEAEVEILKNVMKEALASDNRSVIKEEILCATETLQPKSSPQKDRYSEEGSRRFFSENAEPYAIDFVQDFFNRLIFMEQCGDNLWEKMKHALSVAFEYGAERAILFGSDVPEITAEILEDAILALDQRDTVLNPTVDGGYYLIGMRSLIPQAFEKIGSEVFDDTLSAIERAGKACAIGKRLHDIDTLEDLEQYQERLDSVVERDQVR